ncbi:hypothetical protein NIB75_19175 [Bacteroides uniformis]|nr:hypothetical protein [Bacteroides uniformis]
MKSYYYLDYLHREIFLEEEDIQTVPESQGGRCLFRHCRKSRMSWSSSWRTLSGHSKMWPAACAIPLILKSRHDALMYIVWRVALDIKEWRTLSHSEAAVKVTREDGFVWLLVSAENARKLWEADVFSLYRLYADDSESPDRKRGGAGIDYQGRIPDRYRGGVRLCNGPCRPDEATIKIGNNQITKSRRKVWKQHY